MFSVAGLLVQGAAAGEHGGGVCGDQHDVQAVGLLNSVVNPIGISFRYLIRHKSKLSQ